MLYCSYTSRGLEGARGDLGEAVCVRERENTSSGTAHVRKLPRYVSNPRSHWSDRKACPDIVHICTTITRPMHQDSVNSSILGQELVGVIVASKKEKGIVLF